MEREAVLTLGEWMTPDPITISSDQTIGDALILMLERDIRHLPVLEHDKLVGIVSDRDIRQFHAKVRISYKDRLEEDRYLTLPVTEVMSCRPLTGGLRTQIDEAVKLMVNYKIGSLPVTDRENTIVGIFTEIDALQYCLYLIERHQGMRA